MVTELNKQMSKKNAFPTVHYRQEVSCSYCINRDVYTCRVFLTTFPRIKSFQENDHVVLNEYVRRTS